MTDRHLTEEQLQDYLDGALAESDPVIRHLDDCPRCRQALQSYRRLYDALELEPARELSPDFADKVVARLPESYEMFEAETIAGRFRLRDSLVFFIAAAAVLAAAVYFLNPMSLLASIAGVTDKAVLSDNRFLASLFGRLDALEVGFPFVVFAVLTIFGVGTIDRVLRRRSRHRRPMSYLI